MKIEIVNSISEYLHLVHRTEYFKNCWYRGLKNTEYRLVPTLYRNKKEIISGTAPIQFRHYEFKDEELAIKEFKKTTQKKYDKFNLSDIDILYLMQHNGIETRLLDFTINPLVALFFSVAETKKVSLHKENFDDLDEFDEECSTVFCLDPLQVNKISFGQEKIIDLTFTPFIEIKNLLTPICIEPKNKEIDNRLKAQNGRFVLFGIEVNPLDWYDIIRKDLLKVLIPNSKRDRILNQLDKKFNINYSTIYPDMEGVKFQVNKKIESKFAR